MEAEADDEISSNSSEDAVAIASDDEEDVENPGNDGLQPPAEGESDDDEDYIRAIPWNSPEGFEGYLKARGSFLKEIGNLGRGCAVCGERKQKGSVLTADDLMHKFFAAASKRELLQMLYPEYPKRELESQVGVFYCSCSNDRNHSGRVLGASRRARRGRSGSQTTNSRKNISYNTSP